MIGTLEDGDGVAGTVELRGGGQAGGAGADHRDFLTRAHLGRLGQHPALLPTALDDRELDVLDRDGRAVDAEHAGAFARRRTDAAGKLRKIIRLVQALERFAPKPAVDEIVPLRDQIGDRAAGGHAAEQLAGVAEGHAAIHAARALVPELLLLHVVVKLIPVARALEWSPVHGQLPQVFDKSSWFSHGAVSWR